MNQVLHPKIAKEAGTLITELQTKGWSLSTLIYDARSFGNWYVELCRESDCIQITKGRNQYNLSGPPIAELQAAELWKAFDDWEEFHHCISNWVPT
ncbi:hypothetical protein [Edaphobacter aggregans]|uniref:hypothetical protein n=1 Tax=Edaphobacter aggregans TaxID=570835 RepID=UPI0012F7242C|nr:hypothetical protein [Edaphobacter aggregans]